MNPALRAMLAGYPTGSVDGHINAVREVLQELVLLGLWRGKFFDRAAFYGGTALRVLHGLDRFSEDMDFSLLRPDKSFALEHYLPFVAREVSAWGFKATVEVRKKTARSAVESAFLKADSKELLLVIEAGEDIVSLVPSGRLLRVRFEVDTNPPPDFVTETGFCLRPIPFSVLAYAPPSLFAGKMHAVLCRGWRKRVKGRDWYDFVWFVGRGVELNLRHLEARMRQTGHYYDDAPLSEARFRQLLEERIAGLDIELASADTARFLIDASAVAVWSRGFFRAVASRVKVS
jgi:predicted nucleotidyltransferase component of viral defense system